MIDLSRRRIFHWLAAAGGLFAANRASAHHTDTHFEERSEHQVVFQCNKADYDYWNGILFAVGELIREYGDDVEVIVTAFGPGIHLLAKRPLHPVPREFQERVSSLTVYGVSFHACQNTMNSLQWTEEDLVEVAKVVPRGAEDLMLLQERGFAYISW